MSVPQDEIKEWRLAIEQVIYSNEYERNIHPLKLKASVVHGLNSAVRMDHPDALCLMGMCHLRLKLAPSLGEFFEPSAEKGFNLLEKAVEHKSSAAMYQVAECCRLGLGTEVDKRKAVALYERAANEPISFRAAQRQLGILYFDGEAVQQDHRRAVHWFQLASQQDDTEDAIFSVSVSPVSLGTEHRGPPSSCPALPACPDSRVRPPVPAPGCGPAGPVLPARGRRPRQERQARARPL
uniref:Uncharacterized protein n=1 Tax=Tetraselmis sp. GSL018 TaxID=582737 RepID=A0A061QSJ4_9CHLO